MLLHHSTADGPAVTGVAALRAAEGAPFVHPAELATRLSALAAESGAVVAVANHESLFARL